MPIALRILHDGCSPFLQVLSSALSALFWLYRIALLTMVFQILSADS